ncbi:MAG TPA: hypothetical protein P5084_09820 [Paludibacter sp.]|nr:hypothetical protein [Paludibacter sp.]
MKKVILLIIAINFVLLANAQLLLNETFNYSSTILATVAGDPNTSATNNTVGVWYETGKASDSNSSSILIDSEPLYYTGYINSGIGKSAKIENGGSGANTRIDVVRFVSMAEKVTSGTLYYAFLMNVGDIKSWSTTAGAEENGWRDVFTIAEGGSDVLGNSYRGRLFLQQDATEAGKINYTIVKNTSISSSILPTNQGFISAGQTYLFVVRQTFTGGTDCKVEVIVNPAISAIEPASGWINGYPTDVNTFGGTYGIGIRRRNLANSANVFISGIRIARSYSDVVGISTGLGLLYSENMIRTAGKTILTENAGNISVYNLVGSEVLRASTQGQLETALPKGIYMIKFVDKVGNTSSAKVQLN